MMQHCHALDSTLNVKLVVTLKMAQSQTQTRNWH